MDAIDFTPLEKARSRFEEFRCNMVTDRDKCGAIQAFEFSFELAWKMMKRCLVILGKEVHSPRAVFREAALSGMIDAPEVWFVFLEKRNLTVHAYEAARADEVVAVFTRFSEELGKLVVRLSEMGEASWSR